VGNIFALICPLAAMRINLGMMYPLMNLILRRRPYQCCNTILETYINTHYSTTLGAKDHQVGDGARELGFRIDVV
jgi:hypothetical protein